MNRMRLPITRTDCLLLIRDGRDPDGIKTQGSRFLFDDLSERHGGQVDRLPRSTHESNAEFDRAMDRLALAARTGNLGLPVGFLLIESALEPAALRDCRPWLCSSRYHGHLASFRERNLTRACGLIFIHGEAAGQFGGGSCVLHLLSMGVGRTDQQHQENSRTR